MKATVKVTAIRDVRALQNMLEYNAMWLVRTHNGHIVKVARVPPETPIDDFVDAGDTDRFLSEGHSTSD